MSTEKTLETNSPHSSSPPATHRILVVDDEPINQQIMGAILKRLGYSVTNAANGELALAAASEESFDLIFMDIQMPVMDGVEATRLLRSRPEYLRNASTPVIALSAYALPGDDAIWKSAGMNDQLAKPVTLGSLKTILDSHLSD